MLLVRMQKTNVSFIKNESWAINKSYQKCELESAFKIFHHIKKR